MIWVTWRHHRTSIIVSLGIMVSLGILAVLSVTALNDDAIIDIATAVIATMLPMLLGALVGVTVFSRDIEQGTHVLGLTQSVSRVRWFWARVLVVFVPLTAGATLLGFALEWTRRPREHESFAFVSGRGQFVDLSNLTYPFFQSSGLALGAYTFMALMLGAACALLVRSSIGAVALTMVGVIGVLVMFQFFARPHYAPLTVDASPIINGGVTYTATEDDSIPGVNWEINQGYVDIRGNSVDLRYDECTWGGSGEGNSYDQRPEETGAEYTLRIDELEAQQDRGMEVCLQEQGVDHYETRYHSADQFRRFQLTEAALVLVLSGVFMIPALWGLRRLKP
ncbi:ABC transporter permease [Rhodococcus sp. OK302]|uniref:ABC transporter permease n=1 Tax=Rhodococcus sp. OK302 TaxID=1882769 RepID=UPI000B9F540F|nr:ABC transporter permease [Rhodococcus sp. OK302]OYD67056.1 hypothetical protein BDB13_0559 [Rhodococcus sp. OK302]